MDDIIFDTDCDLIEDHVQSDCYGCYRYGICYSWYYKCDNCSKYPPHISKCHNDNGMCIKFPYDMMDNNQFLYDPKDEYER